MTLTLGEAAKETGLAKSAISRAIKSGRLSAVRQESGSFAIDPAELFRVYPRNSRPEQKTERLATPEDTEAQRRELVLLRELLEEVRGERDNLRTDRDRWQQQAERITLLLTHQPQPAAAETPRPGLWRRLFGSP
jgi:hypothetical protein